MAYGKNSADFNKGVADVYSWSPTICELICQSRSADAMSAPCGDILII